MKNKILIIAALSALLAVPVFAAVSDQEKAQNNCFNSEQHQQMMQQAVKNGTITAEEAEKMNENMKEMAPVMQKIMGQGGMMGNGAGMMGNGSRMMNNDGQGPCHSDNDSSKNN